MTFELTFVRHGQSVGNADGYHQGQSEFPLTEKGKAQARALADKWAQQGGHFDQIISSPLSRARQTAEILNESLNCPLEYDPVWMERDNGVLAGLKRDESDKVHPLPDFLPLYQRIGKNGESEWLLHVRAGRALQSLLSRPPGKYLIVGHGGLLNKVFQAMLGIKIQANFQGVGFSFSNTGVSRFRYVPETNLWWVYAINDTDHLAVRGIRPAEMMLTVVRHGESEGNVLGVFQGQAEYPLTEAGRQQAQALAKRWYDDGVAFSKIFASSATRASETAQIIGETLDMPILEKDAWKEIDNGKMAGLNGEQIGVQFPERADHISPYIPIGETGESHWELYVRAASALQEIMEQPPGHYLVVSHGAMLNALIRAILGILPASRYDRPIFAFGNTSIANLSYQPERNLWRVERFGDQAHLNQAMN